MSRALLLLAVAVGGCSLLGDDALRPIEGSLSVSILPAADGLPAEAAPDRIVVETIRVYGCANYELVVETEVRDGGLTVDVLGVHEPDACARARGPASASVALPPGNLDGFRVDVVVPGVLRDAYVLRQRAGTYEIEPVYTTA